MDTSLLVVVLVGLLLLAGLVIFVLALLFVQSRNSAEKKLLIWQQTRLEMIRKELAETAQRQFESWRKAELDNVRVAMRESVRNELKVIFEQWKLDYEKSIRKDAAAKSQSTLVGKITEHFIPYLPDFSYNPQDARFLGSPIDFIVFDGLSEGALRKIVFIEVKTNAGSLTVRERQIRDVVNAKAVEWIPIKRKMDISDEIDDGLV
jgi:predicted Holliday junction resolvase-like endonuclease